MSRRAALRFSVLLSLVCVAGAFMACGGAVESGGPSPSPTGTGSPTGAPTGAPTTSPTGPSPTPACTHTADGMYLQLWGSFSLAECRPMTKPAAPPSSFDAVITRAGVTTVELDLCSPAADCVPRPLTISATAPRLDLSHLLVGSYVHVELQLEDNPFSCNRAVYMTSLASWGGMKNPVDAGGRLYFAAADGMLGSPALLPFRLSAVHTNCALLPLGASASCTSPDAVDDYALLFNTVSVGMGTTSNVVAGRELYTVRNLRSFQSNFCDAAWDWAWWAVVQDGLGAL